MEWDRLVALVVCCSLISSAKPVPFTIAVKHSEISTIAGDTVVLSVSPSQEVKNGSWRYGGKDVVTWEGTLPEVNPDYRRRAAILAKSSLQLKSVSTSDTGEYSVTMSTASGNTSTAKIYLNVHTKRQPIDVSPVLSRINAEIGARVLLAVTISGEVKNGSWSTENHILFQWNSTIQNVTEHSWYQLDLLPNASLLIPFVHMFTFTKYTITLESPSGDKAVANITMKVFKSARSCETYNVGLAISILLMLICILVIANHIRKKNQTAAGEIHDFLTVFCKGYRVCVSLTMVMSFNFLIIFSSLINWYLCAPGERPAMDFSQN